MAAAWQASGTLLGSTGADITPVIPTHAAGDILICMAASRVVTDTCVTPPGDGGWAVLAGPTNNTGWRVYVFWIRATSGAMANPVLDWTGTGEKYGQVHTIRGAIATGSPFANSALTVDLTDPIVATGVTTTLDGQLVVAIGIGSDNASASVTVTATNPTPLTQRHFSTITTGNDATGSFHEAIRTTAGASGNVTLDHNSTMPAEGVLVAAIINPITQTSVARISLAAGGTPVTATDHSIKVRARTTAGAGTIRAALYEGANNRSGDLESTALTTSLADYTLAIPDASAANITDYSDLEIRLWGYAAAGGAIVFEVDQLWLETPEAGATTHFGSVTLPLTATIGTAGFAKKTSSVTLPLTATIAVAGFAKKTSSVTLPLTMTIAVNGVRKALGSVTLPLTLSISTAGFALKRGVIDVPLTMTFTTAGYLNAKASVTLPLTVSFTTTGGVKLLGSVTLPLSVTFDTAGITKRTGSVTFPLTIDFATSGYLNAKGSVTLPLSMSVSTAGFAAKRSSATLPLTFTVATNATRKTYSSLDLPLSMNMTTAGRMTARSSSTWPILIGFEVQSGNVKSGSVTFPITASIDTAGFATKRGSVTQPFTLSISTTAFKTTRSSATLPLTITFDTTGYKATTSSATWPIVISFNTNGRQLGIVYDAGYPGHIARGYIGGTLGSSGYIARPTTGSVT